MYIKQLYADRHYGEMIHQISTLPRLQGVAGIRDKLLRQMIRASSTERGYWFKQMSMELGLYNDANMHGEGIAIARNYRKYFLEHLTNVKETAEEVRFWCFDTDFYLLTMYDHFGAAGECEKCLKACYDNLASINHSWEYMDYYFRFRLRELNVLLGRFAFDELLAKADKLCESFREVSEVFQRMGDRDGMDSVFQSELLGKAQGIRLQALINLVTRDPRYFKEALQASDQALREFSRPEDLRRQWQYRSQLMASAGRAREALACLLRSLDIDPDDTHPFDKAVAVIYGNEQRTDVYSLLHYTNVLLQFASQNLSEAEKMGAVLLDHPRFKKDCWDQNNKRYPWNRVFWHLAQYARIIGDKTMSSECYARALAATRQDPTHLTLMTFAVSITAERLLHAGDLPAVGRAMIEQDWLKANREFRHGNVPQEIRDWFGIDQPDAEWQARAWLK